MPVETALQLGDSRETTPHCLQPAIGDDGLTFKAIAQRIYDAICEKEGRRKGSAEFHGWSQHRARELYLREKRLQKQGL